MFPVVSEIFIETICFKIHISAILPYSYGRITLTELVERYWIDRLVPGKLNLVYVHKEMVKTEVWSRRGIKQNSPIDCSGWTEIYGPFRAVGPRICSCQVYIFVWHLY